MKLVSATTACGDGSTARRVPSAVGCTEGAAAVGNVAGVAITAAGVVPAGRERNARSFLNSSGVTNRSTIELVSAERTDTGGAGSLGEWPFRRNLAGSTKNSSPSGAALLALPVPGRACIATAGATLEPVTAAGTLVSMLICSGATTSDSTLCRSAAAPCRTTSKRTLPPARLSTCVSVTAPISPRPCSIISSSAASIASTSGDSSTLKCRVNCPAGAPAPSIDGKLTRSSIIASTWLLSGARLSTPRWCNTCDLTMSPALSMASMSPLPIGRSPLRSRSSRFSCRCVSDATSVQPSIPALPLIEWTARKIAFRSSGRGASVSRRNRMASTLARCSWVSSKKISRNALASPRALESCDIVAPR